jgi:hypothetical protein
MPLKGGDVRETQGGPLMDSKAAQCRAAQRTNTVLESTPDALRIHDLNENLDIRLAPESPCLGIQGDLQLN